MAGDMEVESLAALAGPLAREARKTWKVNMTLLAMGSL